MVAITKVKTMTKARTMKKARTTSLLGACILLVAFAGCDKGYPPIIANGCGFSVDISLSFAGVPQPSSGVLPAGSEVVQRRKGLNLIEIRLKEPSGRLRVYGKTELDAARMNTRVELEVWILSEQGLRLGDKEDLRKFRAKTKT